MKHTDAEIHHHWKVFLYVADQNQNSNSFSIGKLAKIIAEERKVKIFLPLVH